MTIGTLPEGVETSDIRWQNGYNDGCEDNKPHSPDPVYIAGWVTGYQGGNQCGFAEALEAYHESKRG